MHLSRFITIANCAMTFIGVPPPAPRRCASVPHLLAATADDGHLVALVTGRPQVVERERVLAVATGQVAGLDPHPGQRIVVTAPLVVGFGARRVHGALLDVV